MALFLPEQLDFKSTKKYKKNHEIFQKTRYINATKFNGIQRKSETTISYTSMRKK